MEKGTVPFSTSSQRFHETPVTHGLTVMGYFILVEYLVASFLIEIKVLPIIGEQHHGLASALANVIFKIGQELSTNALAVERRIHLNHTQVPYIGIVFLIIMTRSSGLLVIFKESMQMLPVGKEIHLKISAQNEPEYRWLLVTWWFK